MRRLLLILALGAGLGLPAPLGSSEAPATLKPVAYWLGTWDTNAGKLVFDDLERKRSDCTACGNPLYWALEGHWTHPAFDIVDGSKTIHVGASTTRIAGSVGGKDFDTFQGEWVLPQQSPFYNDGGSALIYRDGNTIGGAHSGGYWKACPYTSPPGPKCPHGSWGPGEKKQGLWYVNATVHQNGSPDHHRAIETSISGGLALILKDRDASAGEFINSRLRYNEVLPLEHIQLTFLPLRGTVHEGDRRTWVGFRTVVADSNSKDCPVGTSFGISVKDGRGLSPDEIIFHEIPLSADCFGGSREQTWTSLDKNRVNVTVNPPRETK